MTQPEVSSLPTIERDPRRIRVLFGGHEVADSADALVVREPGKSPVWYFPRGDVEMTILARTQLQTLSPSKGPATYFSLYRDGHVVENAIWSFENPPPAFRAIEDRIAFLPVHFEFEAEGHTAADWDLANAGGREDQASAGA
jgi:uncharacterized protein (DUF427 family)